MKANRKFVQADEAVSPVIAVILMVAITVVLAATVFVLVSDIGSKSAKNAPQIGWSDDETNDRWQINQAPPTVPWSGFQLKASAFSASMTAWKASVNADSNAANAGTSTGTGYVTITVTTNMAGGDYLEFCAVGAAGTNIEFVMLHSASNSIAHRFTFAALALCA